MLARKTIPAEFKAWNARWNAPFGPEWARSLSLRRRLQDDVVRRLGPFGFQPKNTTRTFEYPWVYFTASVTPGTKVLEIGGALSGLQFVLSKERAEVTNVDPFNDYGVGETYCDSDEGVHAKLDCASLAILRHNMLPDSPEAIHAKLNGLFGTRVSLNRSTLAAAGFPDGEFDIAVSVSTLEHLPWPDICETVHAVHRLLRPGGRFVLTMDLFVDTYPFTDRVANQWGTNISIGQLVNESRMDLVVGQPDELFGFPSFDVDQINRHRDDYLIGYPAMVQTLVLRKQS